MKKPAKTPAAPRYYFAYGSNINLPQMAARCPHATRIGTVTLADHILSFKGRSRIGGVADVTPQEGATVPGLLWDITPWCEAALDRYEGYPTLYTKKNVTVYGQDGTEYKAMVYVMTKEYQAPAMPGGYYCNVIGEGYRANGIDLDALEAAVNLTYHQLKEAR